ncbi:MAG: phosphoribosyltransferase family protein [Candidatus Odinarchaeota archaeon]
MAKENYCEKIKTRLKAIEALKTLKQTHSYSELSKKTGVPTTVLNRYIKGHLLPSYLRARKILSMFQYSEETITGEDIKKLIAAHVKFDKNGFFNNTQIVTNTVLLRSIGAYIKEKYNSLKIDKILTAAVDGIPLATHVASNFNVPVIFGKYSKEIGVDAFYEAVSSIEASGIVTTMYLPKNLLLKGEAVLIVDDVIRSGETQKMLVSITEEASAKLLGIIVLLGIGEKWRNSIKLDSDAFIEVLYQLKE